MLDPDPPAPPTSPAATAWLSRAQALARRVNLGWCVDQLVVALPVTAAVATALVLYLRMAGIAAGWVFLTAVLALLGAAIYAWQRAKNRFIDRRQALVRLESALHLDAALSSASQGIGSWPEMRSARDRAALAVGENLLAIFTVTPVDWPSRALADSLDTVGSKFAAPQAAQHPGSRIDLGATEGGAADRRRRCFDARP